MGTVPAFLAGAGATAAIGGGALAVHSARKRKRNRELLARIRPPQVRKEFCDASGHVIAVEMGKPDGSVVRFGMTFPQRIIAFAATLSFDRTRNTDGEFSPAAAGTADPSAMLKTYGSAPGLSGRAKAGLALGGAGVAAAGGAALIRSLRKRK